MKEYFKLPRGPVFLTCLAIVCISTLANVAVGATDSVDLNWRAPLAQDHPLVGEIYTAKAAITTEALADLMAASGYVLIGEKHDNIDHHQLELYLLKLLSERISGADENPSDESPSMGVTLEMLDRSQQSQIDQVMKQLDQSDDDRLEVADLKSALNWPEHGWPWGSYSALIGWTLNGGLPLYAGNISRETMKSVYQTGIADQFISAKELHGALNEALLDQVFDGHCGLMPKDSLGSMVDIQLVKDSSMASALVAASGKPGVLIAGTGHVRKDTAVPRHLQVLDDKPILTVALIEVDLEKRFVADYNDSFDQFDVVIFTPVANDRDYCADLEQSMHKK